jgi:hypothetical protein
MLSPLKTIRAKCLDCCVFQYAEVLHCSAIKCPLHPYRMGRRPQTLARKELARKMRDTPNETKSLEVLEQETK